MKTFYNDDTDFFKNFELSNGKLVKATLPAKAGSLIRPKEKKKKEKKDPRLAMLKKEKDGNINEGYKN